MNGGMDFRESFSRRIGLLAGLDERTCYDTLIARIRFTPGVFLLAKRLNGLGASCAIVSGGFRPIAEYVQHHLGFEYCFANVLSTANGKLTGGFDGELIDAGRKVEILKKLRETLEIPRANVHGPSLCYSYRLGNCSWRRSQ